MDTLKGIDKLFIVLAETFQTTVDVIQKYLPEYILKFAKYHFVTNIFETIIIGCIVGVFISIIYVIVSICIDDILDLQIYNNRDKLYKKAIWIPIGVIIFLIAGEFLKFIASPEIYGIRELLKLINK